MAVVQQRYYILVVVVTWRSYIGVVYRSNLRVYSMPNKITAVSLFSGCGGFDYGAQQAGLEIIWANDIDPHAAAAYRALLPDVKFKEDDIRNIETFPEADVLIGCYPCTGFSMAARRRGKKLEERDLRSNSDNYLYKEFLRALAQIKPKYLFVENVKGMLTAAGGWFLNQQIKGFEEAGYRVKYEPLNARDFGVAQTRKRVFIVGVREDISNDFEYEFPEPIHGPEGNKPEVVLEDVIGDMELWPEGEYSTKEFHGHYLTRNRKRSWEEPSYTIVAHAHHVTLHPMGEPMKNIGKDQWVLQGEDNRRLSWRECAAIQALPPETVPSGQLEDKYRVVGNAVPPPLGKVLLGPVIEFEDGSIRNN